MRTNTVLKVVFTVSSCICLVCDCTDMEQAGWAAVPGLDSSHGEQNKKSQDSSMFTYFLNLYMCL